MTAAQHIKIYQTLRKHYGAAADVAAATVEIEQIVAVNATEKIGHLATKADLSEAKVDIIKWMVGVFLALALMVLGLYVRK